MHPIGSIKKWLGHKKKKNQGTPSASEIADKVYSEAERDYLQNEIPLVSDFIPQAKGTEATLGWLERRTPEALSRLTIERDRAAKQNSRGPKNKGTKEVKKILMKPCRTTVEQLHHVRNQAELSVRYGTATGAVMYNLGRSMNRKSYAPKLPSLQLKDFSTMVKEHLDVVGKLPGSTLGSMTLRSSLDLRTPSRRVSSEASSMSPARGRSRRCSSGIEDERLDSSLDSQRTGSTGDRALSPLSAESDSENDPYENMPQSPENRTAEEQWEAQEATFVSIVQVPTQVIRKVQIRRKKKRQLSTLSRISEVSILPGGVVTSS